MLIGFDAVSCGKYSIPSVSDLQENRVYRKTHSIVA